MANQVITASSAPHHLAASRFYGMGALFLLAGLAIGYLVPGTQTSPNSPRTASATTLSTSRQVHPLPRMADGHMPTLEDMKRMANKQAIPLLNRLKSNPKDSDILAQLGAIYHSTHQFKQAAEYYGRAVEADPKNAALRAKLASSLYRNGDVDGAIAQLNKGLTYDPKDANSLFNLGMIKLQGKKDGKGAVAAWQRLLKANPQLSPDRKAQVQKLMADVLTSLGDQYAMQGVRRNDGHRSNSN